MAHRHSIYDTDLHFIIDPITRRISSESGKVTLMQNDHNSERFTFQLPRYIEGHDMSLCNHVQVHYTNKDPAKKTNQYSDIYVITDLQVSPESEEVVIGSWLISQKSTQFSGSLEFVVRFACISEEEPYDIEYQWFTDIYSVIKIAKGIYNVDVVTCDDDTDVLAAWKAEILAMATPLVEDARNSAESAAESAEKAAISMNNAASLEATVLACVESTTISEAKAKESEIKAKESEIKAKESELNAKISEENAANSEAIASSSITAIESISDSALAKLQETGAAIAEFEKKLENTTFSINTETGNLEYESPNYAFNIDETTGYLEWEVL